MSKGFLNLMLLWITSLLVYKVKPHKLARLQETEKIKHIEDNNELLRLTSRDAAPEGHQVRPESLETFQPSLYASSKGK